MGANHFPGGKCPRCDWLGPVTRGRTRGSPSRDSDPLRKGINAITDTPDLLHHNEPCCCLDRAISLDSGLIASICSLRRLPSSRCDGVCVILVYPGFDLLLIVLLVTVAVQQPYAMQWSLTNAASPAAIALGKNLQTRLVGYGCGFCQRFYRAPALLRRSHIAISTS